MTNYNLDLSNILSEVQHHWKDSAVVEYICDQLKDSSWDSVESFIGQLESASCANGSWGQDTIYTHRILALLSDESWRDAINQALEDYADATGENYSPETLNLESLVTFAVDWYAGEIASYIRSFNRVWIAILDKGEVWESREAYLYESEADSVAEQAIQARMDSEVAHSPYSLTEDAYNALYDSVSESYVVIEERM